MKEGGSKEAKKENGPVKGERSEKKGNEASKEGRKTVRKGFKKASEGEIFQTRKKERKQGVKGS